MLVQLDMNHLAEYHRQCKIGYLSKLYSVIVLLCINDDGISYYLFITFVSLLSINIYIKWSHRKGVHFPLYKTFVFCYILHSF
jgi:hypothetical protein